MVRKRPDSHDGVPEGSRKEWVVCLLFVEKRKSERRSRSGAPAKRQHEGEQLCECKDDRTPGFRFGRVHAFAQIDRGACSHFHRYFSGIWPTRPPRSATWEATKAASSYTMWAAALGHNRTHREFTVTNALHISLTAPSIVVIAAHSGVVASYFDYDCSPPGWWFD